MHVNRDLTLGRMRIFLENIKKIIKLSGKRDSQDESKIFLLGSTYNAFQNDSDNFAKHCCELIQ